MPSLPHRVHDADASRLARAERLLAIGRSLTSELDLPKVLSGILDAARELTGAEYAALGVLDEEQRHLADFLTTGLDADAERAIGDRPRGHGVLGLLIADPRTIRLHDVSQHPRSYGFPAGHPPMRSFLGTPILIDGLAWGNLYLTEKHGAEDFTDDDVDTIVVLAEWAAVAIGNANRYREATDQRCALERTLRVAQATHEVGAAIGSETDLERILALIVRRGRALVDADSLLIWLCEGDDLRLAVAAGAADVPTGATMPLADSTSGEVLLAGTPRRIPDIDAMRISPRHYGITEPHSALIVPLIHRGQPHGVLVALDRLGGTASFDADDERTLEAFAASAAIAVATARSVAEQRLQNSLAAAEAERQRWARELHDETLQSLAALKLTLTRALNAEPEQGREIITASLAHIDRDIDALRAIIADLRPAALDELGLEPALLALVSRVADQAEVDATTQIDLGGTRLPPELETTAYRIAQEALTNVAKHAEAAAIRVDAQVAGGRLHLEVSDDGRGVGDSPGGGFGLIGMRERAGMAGGELSIGSPPDGGTRVRLDVPVPAHERGTSAVHR